MSDLINTSQSTLFNRVIAILEDARGNVVHAVNSNMVMAYWLIGREIVQELQGGEERAEYGRLIIEGLAKQLTEWYGTGFSIANLKNFRQFYLAYPHRLAPIGYPSGSQLPETQKSYPPGGEFAPSNTLQTLAGERVQGFSPQLSWSHYRALMRVQDEKAREFYEREAVEGGWDKRTLERQIHTQYFERCLHSQQPEISSPKEGVFRKQLRSQPISAPPSSKPLPQLTVFAASSIVEFNRILSFFLFRLTMDTQSNAGHRFSTALRDFNLAFFAIHQTFAIRKPAFCQFNSGTDCGIHLLLNRIFVRPTDSHPSFLSFQSVHSKLESQNF